MQICYPEKSLEVSAKRLTTFASSWTSAPIRDPLLPSSQQKCNLSSFESTQHIYFTILHEYKQNNGSDKISI